jgi:ankyrin repeat protein
MAVLPPNPNLEQLRKRAKNHARASGVKLADAQFAIAREHGFPSWPRLRAYVQRVEEHGPEIEHAYQADIQYYADRATGLLASAEDGTPDAVASFESRQQLLTRDGARVVVARAHGFPSWRTLREHVRSLADSGEPFARAYRYVEERDLDGLTRIVAEFPSLVHARGTNGNDLLGMAGATCDERLSRVLLDAGADPARGNAHGWTPLHQGAYSNLPLLLEMLLAAGAPVDVSARGDGGTPLVVALFWGHREAAEALAVHSLAPGNLRVAAGLGRLDLIDELVTSKGELAAEAGAHREFYRPHSGFGSWRPSDDPAEIRNEALAWAARNDRTDAVEALVELGAELDADVYAGTPLLWASAQGKPDAVRKLVELGADVNRRSTFGGPGHGSGVTALHLAAQNNRVDVLRILLDAGADTTVRDNLYDGTPEGWAEHFDRKQALKVFRG